MYVGWQKMTENIMTCVRGWCWLTVCNSDDDIFPSIQYLSGSGTTNEVTCCPMCNTTCTTATSNKRHSAVGRSPVCNFFWCKHQLVRARSCMVNSSNRSCVSYLFATLAQRAGQTVTHLLNKHLVTLQQ